MDEGINNKVISPSLPIDQTREQWFSSVPIYVVFLVLIIVYAFSGFYFHRFNEVLAGCLTPIVNGLGFVGIKIAPILVGPLDDVFYKNLSGLSFIGASTYNLASFVYMIVHRRVAALSCVDAHAKLMKRKQWGAKKTWLILHFYVYVGVSALGVFLTACLLNGVFHWWVFAVARGDVLNACLISIYFCFAGMMPTCLYSVVLQYAVFDVTYFFRKIYPKI
ncbi:hypothetical protein HX882_27260 [Pseudomonas gingeri]|uniref:Uncharacterized protein n=1 Tax=Pseudomonas gingeri TaxID=117681 RepID=A0A7Y8C4V7_9PSED|nr:hypothetical protein [Pseudomonas gingeri]NWB99588.1 hypothetical protein [Pseudomonas gingeri]